MSDHVRDDGGAVVALAILRATLLAVILFSEQIVDARQLAHFQFFLVLAWASAYALLGIVVALWWPHSPTARVLTRLQPACDVFILSALAYTSGGGFSDARKAFFVIPLAAAFSERPRTTANWSLLAVAAFTLQAALAGGHPAGARDDWQRVTFDHDLYLGWTGAAATMLSVALRRRSSHTEELARSRQRLVTQAIASVERERTRLAGALHDSPVQNLIAARHDLRRAERLGDPDSFVRLHQAIDATIAELREEIFDLYPHVLDHVGLSAALEQVARRHAGDSDLRIAVDVDAGLADRQVLFALGRELLGNAAKHAHATEIGLSLTRHDGYVILLVSDDGCGIPEGRMQRALLDGHIGLAAVRERVTALGGTLAIQSAEGVGTAVRIVLPAPGADGRSASASVKGVSDRVTLNDTLGVSTG